jgi:hypothetical protein
VDEGLCDPDVSSQSGYFHISGSKNLNCERPDQACHPPLTSCPPLTLMPFKGHLCCGRCQVMPGQAAMRGPYT